MEPETVFYRKTNSRYYHDNSSLEQDFPCCPIAFALSLTLLYRNKKKTSILRLIVAFDSQLRKKDSYLTIFSQLAQLSLLLERFSLDCRKTKTKVNTLANQRT